MFSKHWDDFKFDKEPFIYFSLINHEIKTTVHRCSSSNASFRGLFAFSLFWKHNLSKFLSCFLSKLLESWPWDESSKMDRTWIYSCLMQIFYISMWVSVIHLERTLYFIKKVLLCSVSWVIPGFEPTVRFVSFSSILKFLLLTRLAAVSVARQHI